MNKAQLYFKKLPISFWIIVAIPTLISIIYFGLIASDRYVSVSTFVVRSPQKTASVGGLSAFLQNVGFSRSQDDTYVVHQYMTSRDAVTQLDTDLNLKQKYSNTKVDLFSKYNPLGFDNSNESLYDYYQSKVKIDLDTASSISTLSVRAYTAEDALAINAKLLDMGENLVNQLNQRGRQDTIATSEAEVQKAQDKVKELSEKLAQFRTKNQIFDIEKQSALQLQLISKLQDQLIMVKTQLAQVRAVTPKNPQIITLKERERIISQDIAKETQKMLGGSQSINQKSTEYEQIALEKDVATKQLASTLVSLEQNRNEAERKQLYLERISKPQKPDTAVEPKRLKNIISVLVLSLLIWGIFTMLFASVREHND